MYQGPFDAQYTRNLQAALSLCYSTGLTLYLPWQLLEPADGRFNWLYIDEALSIAAAQGKTISLGLVVSSFTPDWVKARSQTFAYTHPNATIGRQIAPIPWDPYYQDRLSETILALGKRYNGNSHLLFVVIDGPATLWGTETNWMMLPNSLSAEDQAKLNFSLAKYVASWERMIRIFFQAFPSTDLALALNNQIDVSASTSAKMDAVKEIRDYAISQQRLHQPCRKLWLELLGLTAGKDGPAQFTGLNTDRSAITPYVSLVWDVHDLVNIDYQANYVFRRHKPPYTPADAMQAMNIGVSFGADIIEIKFWDLINAQTGKPYAQYETVFQNSAAALAKNHAPASASSAKCSL